MDRSILQKIYPNRPRPTQRHDNGWSNSILLLTSSTIIRKQKFKTLNRRLKREQKSLSRKFEFWKNLKDNFAPRSANYEKNKIRLAKLHARISDHRNDSLHKLTTYLTKNFSEVVIEDLNVSGMMKNRKLAKAIANGSFYEFRRQLEYKGAWYGCEIIVANRFFASSKICSNCGCKNENLKLKDRNWTCESCGKTHERDLNASVNLRDYPEKYAASFAVKACGVGSSAHFACSPTLKQETNTKPT